MNRPARLVTGIVFLLSAIAYAQLDRIVIPAGTPEDIALTEIGKEQDAQKKTAMYEDFLQKFSANPAAVAYGALYRCLSRDQVRRPSRTVRHVHSRAGTVK